MPRAGQASGMRMLVVRVGWGALVGLATLLGGCAGAEPPGPPAPTQASSPTASAALTAPGGAASTTPTPRADGTSSAGRTPTAQPAAGATGTPAPAPGADPTGPAPAPPVLPAPPAPLPFDLNGYPLYLGDGGGSEENASRLPRGVTYSIGGVVLFTTPSSGDLLPLGRPLLPAGGRWRFGFREAVTGSELFIGQDWGEQSRRLAGERELQAAADRLFDDVLATFRAAPPAPTHPVPTLPLGATQEAVLQLDLATGARRLLGARLVGAEGVAWDLSTPGVAGLRYRSRVPLRESWAFLREHAVYSWQFETASLGCTGDAPDAAGGVLTCESVGRQVVLRVSGDGGDLEFPTAVEVSVRRLER